MKKTFIFIAIAAMAFVTSCTNKQVSTEPETDNVAQAEQLLNEYFGDSLDSSFVYTPSETTIDTLFAYPWLNCPCTDSSDNVPEMCEVCCGNQEALYEIFDSLEDLSTVRVQSGWLITQKYSITNNISDSMAETTLYETVFQTDVDFDSVLGEYPLEYKEFVKQRDFSIVDAIHFVTLKRNNKQ